jgi:hypothetical protein
MSERRKHLLARHKGQTISATTDEEPTFCGIPYSQFETDAGDTPSRDRDSPEAKAKFDADTEALWRFLEAEKDERNPRNEGSVVVGFACEWGSDARDRGCSAGHFANFPHDFRSAWKNYLWRSGTILNPRLARVIEATQVNSSSQESYAGAAIPQS